MTGDIWSFTLEDSINLLYIIMSWDIVLFNSKQRIANVAEIDEQQLVPTNFCKVFEEYFTNISVDDNHKEIIGESFSIDYFTDDEHVSNKMVSVYGETGLFELIKLAKDHGWQIYDSGLGSMIDLDNPARNGFSDFNNYLNQILESDV